MLRSAAREVSMPPWEMFSVACPANALTPSACAVLMSRNNSTLQQRGSITQPFGAAERGGLCSQIQPGFREQYRKDTGFDSTIKPPHYSGIVHSHARWETARVLQEEISSLLNKGATGIVAPHQSQNRYFLVPKWGGSRIRSILDLRVLNKFLRKYKFSMLTHASLLHLVRQGNRFTSVNLKDAYFHIPVYPPHRKYCFSVHVL